MLCKSCGAQIADNSVFCTNCGVRVQPVNEAVSAGTGEQGAAETAVETLADPTAQVETPVQEIAADAQAQVETPAQDIAADAQAQAETPAQDGMQVNALGQDHIPDTQAGNMPDGQPQAGGMWNAQAGNMPDGQPQAGGMWNAQAGNMPDGQPQAGGMWNAQAGNMPDGQPQAGGMWNAQAGNTPNGQPQAGGMWNAQAGNMPGGQPQAGGMWNAQAGNMPDGQPQAGGMWNAQAGNMPNGQPQAGGMWNVPPVKPPKKPFVMPAVVNIVFAILAIAAVAVFVCVLVLGKPKEQKSELAVSTMAIPAQQQAIEPSDGFGTEAIDGAFSLEIPETDAYREAQALAEGYLFEDSDTRNLTQEELAAYTDDELWHAYYEILARAGIDLSEIDDDMHEYFQRKNWYDPDISLTNVLNNMSAEQIERFSEMLDNGEDPSYDVLLEAGVLNETEVYNMKLIEEYVTYGTTSEEGAEGAIEDMLEE